MGRIPQTLFQLHSALQSYIRLYQHFKYQNFRDTETKGAQIIRLGMCRRELVAAFRQWRRKSFYSDSYRKWVYKKD